MHNFKELKIWQKSIELATDIYSLLVDFPLSEKYGLISQIRRSSVSIPSNIAEGSAKESNRDFKRFLSISLGSAFELETQMILSFKLGIVPESTFDAFSIRIAELQKMIFGFMKSIKVKTK